MSNAVERIQAYLDELRTRNTLDQDVIQNLRPEALGEISLRVADLKAVLNALEAVEDQLKTLDAIQKADNVSRNASAHGVACVIREVIDEELS